MCSGCVLGEHRLDNGNVTGVRGSEVHRAPLHILLEPQQLVELSTEVDEGGDVAVLPGSEAEGDEDGEVAVLVGDDELAQEEDDGGALVVQDGVVQRSWSFTSRAEGWWRTTSLAAAGSGWYWAMPWRGRPWRGRPW